MKVEITTMELAELLNTVQGRHKVAQNPLGMSAEDLIERVADRVTEKIQAAIEANAAEEDADDDETLADRISDRLIEHVSFLIEETKRAAAAESVILDGSGLHPLPAGFAPYPVTVIPDEKQEGKAAATDEQPDVVTLGDAYEIEQTPDPNFSNKIIGKKDGMEALEDEPPRKVDSMPVWDESAGVYVVNGNGHIGRDLWKDKKYYEWFNDEIRRLRKEGRSARYIADRLKVRERSVLERLKDSKIE